jgi:SAM-dependent methyltransferase
MKDGGGSKAWMQRQLLQLQVSAILLLNRLFARPPQFQRLKDAKTDERECFRLEWEEAYAVCRRFAPYLDLVGKRVLELGCGLGGKLLFYRQSGAAHVLGLDIEAEYLKIARRCLSEHIGVDLAPPLTLGRAEALPFAADSFDVIMATYTFEHLERPFDVILDCGRVLRPGGRLFISFPPFYSPWGAHLTDWIHFPWGQVVFSQRALMSAALRVETESGGQERLPPFARVHLAGAERFPHVRRLTVAAFERMSKNGSLRVLMRKRLPVDGKALGPLASLPCLLVSVPVICEVLTGNVVCVLEKPEQRAAGSADDRLRSVC